jgi:hypothetical protein
MHAYDVIKNNSWPVPLRLIRLCHLHKSFWLLLVSHGLQHSMYNARLALGTLNTNTAKTVQDSTTSLWFCVGKQKSNKTMALNGSNNSHYTILPQQCECWDLILMPFTKGWLSSIVALHEVFWKLLFFDIDTVFRCFQGQFDSFSERTVFWVLK